MEMEWEGGEDRKKCLGEDKEDLRGHSVFLKMIFGEEKMPKIHIICQKHSQKRQKQNDISPKIFLAKFLGEFLEK
jgi:hypothetical protein